MERLPGSDEPARAAARPRIRSGVPQRPPVFTVRFVLRVAVLGVLLVASLYGYHRLEDFLIRDSRFVWNNPDDPAAPEVLQVEGAAHASHGAIQRVFAEDLGRSIYLLPLADRQAALRSVDWVKGASIARLWPNRVVVRIAERRPVAFLTLGSSRFALIDEDGVILPPVTDRFELPVLAGVRAGDALTERRDRVHRMLRVMQELGDNARALSEIDVSDRDNLKVSQPSDGRIVTVFLGDHNFAVRYQNFVNHYAEIKRRLPGAQTLDLRLEDRITVVE